jgi:hypothetical protein
VGGGYCVKLIPAVTAIALTKEALCKSFMKLCPVILCRIGALEMEYHPFAADRLQVLIKPDPAPLNLYTTCRLILYHPQPFITFLQKL